MKKIMSLIITLTMLLNCLAPLGAVAESGDAAGVQVKIVSASAKKASKKTSKKTSKKAKKSRKSKKSSAKRAAKKSAKASGSTSGTKTEEKAEEARTEEVKADEVRTENAASESQPEETVTVSESRGGEAAQAVEAAEAGAQEKPAEQAESAESPAAGGAGPVMEPLMNSGAEAAQPEAAAEGEAVEQSEAEAKSEEPADIIAPEAGAAEDTAEIIEAENGAAEEAMELAARDGEEVPADSGLITERKEQDENLIATNFSDLENKDTTSTLETVEEHYNLFVDENGVYQLTFTIQEGTDDEEITIDLTKALDALQAYAGATGANTLQPGDTRAFQIWINSESGHTYKYKDGSFILTTPESDAEDIPENPAQGFDGQDLDSEHTGRATRDAYTNLPALQEMLKAQGLDAYDLRTPPSYAISQLQRDLKAKYETDNLTEAVMQCLVDYYSGRDGVDYASFDEMLKQSPDAARDIENTAGRQLSGVKLPSDPAQLYDFWYNDIHRFVYGDAEDVARATGENRNPTTTTKTIYTVTDHDDGAVYDNCYTAAELGSYYVSMMNRYKNSYGYPIGDPAKVLIHVDPQTGRMTFGFANEDGSWAEADSYDGDERTFTTTESAFENVEWHRDPALAEATVADYMKGEDSEFWSKADAYFSQLLADGISADSASAMTKQYVEFMMATNVDGALAGNGYQDTEWGWHNTIDLTRVDGEMDLEKVDGNGSLITDSETTFQLWTYKDTDEDGAYTENDDKFFYTTYENEVTDEATGEKTKVQTQGFVKYDSSNSSLTYTIDTTGGKLHIDYAMLENIVYYLQEVAAPKGYEIDTTVYVICDDEETAAEAERMLKDTTVDTSKGFSYAGAIDSKKPLKIQVVNTKSTTPPSTPGNPPSENPPAETVTIADYNIPLAGVINMNEGDCFN